MGNAVCFISDAHFGSDKADIEQEKKRKFFSFLDHIQGQINELYIVGDLFDFWFEYRSAIFKHHFNILHHLAKLADKGITMTYVAGNHDFWLDSFLSNELGIIVCQNPLEVTHQGLKLFIAHGDGLIGRDAGYRLLKRILRFPPHIWLFKLIHPDLGNFLAHQTSLLSRRFLSKEKKFDFKEEYKKFALRKFNQGFDAVILGHSHQPYSEKINNHHLLDIGNWTHDFTYIILQDGKFELKFWHQ